MFDQVVKISLVTKDEDLQTLSEHTKDWMLYLFVTTTKTRSFEMNGKEEEVPIREEFKKFIVGIIFSFLKGWY